jgi:hypothetical protein
MIAFDAEPLRDVARWVHKYERYWTKKFDQLEDYFREKGEVNNIESKIKTTELNTKEQLMPAHLKCSTPGSIPRVERAPGVE